MTSMTSFDIRCNMFRLLTLNCIEKQKHLRLTVYIRKSRMWKQSKIPKQLEIGLLNQVIGYVSCLAEEGSQDCQLPTKRDSSSHEPRQNRTSKKGISIQLECKIRRSYQTCIILSRSRKLKAPSSAVTQHRWVDIVASPSRLQGRLVNSMMIIRFLMITEAGRCTVTPVLVSRGGGDC